MVCGVEDVVFEVGYLVVFCNFDVQFEKEVMYFCIVIVEYMFGIIIVIVDEQFNFDGIFVIG